MRLNLNRPCRLVMESIGDNCIADVLLEHGRIERIHGAAESVLWPRCPQISIEWRTKVFRLIVIRASELLALVMADRK